MLQLWPLYDVREVLMAQAPQRVRVYKDNATKSWWVSCDRCLNMERAPTQPVAMERTTAHLARHAGFGIQAPTTIPGGP